jgi:hypothetical protein
MDNFYCNSVKEASMSLMSSLYYLMAESRDNELQETCKKLIGLIHDRVVASLAEKGNRVIFSSPTKC